MSLATGFAAAARRELPPDVLSKFASATREKLLATISSPSYRGQIDSGTVQELVRLERIGSDDLMLALLPLARAGSYAPLSNYHVGAVIQGSSQSLYLGNNIEVPGQVLGLAVHGEQAACANAYMWGEKGVTTLAVTGAPCGHCRQFLNEMLPDGSLRVLFPGTAATTLGALLPMAFGPKALGETQGALPIRETRLELREATADFATRAALDAARRAYSPYTRSPAGVAVVTASGRMFSGSYIENVAYNPSLSPFQAALAGLFAAGESASSIVRAVLVETEDARISQKASSQTTLESLAPGARLAIVFAKREL